MSVCILKRIADGDESAVKECISRYGGFVWSLARRLTRTPADAEDATQEIFICIWTQASAFDPAKGSEIGFIAIIARRRLIDRLRKLKSELVIDWSVDVSEVVDWSDPGTSPAAHLDAEVALRTLRQLRPEHRQILELGLIHGLTQSQISARLGIPLGTVKSYMRRGLMQVRESMQAPPLPTSPDRRSRKPPIQEIIKVIGIKGPTEPSAAATVAI